MWQPLQPPRVIAHLASSRFLRDLLGKPSPSRVEMGLVAERIVREHIRGVTFATALQTFLNVCASIDSAKNLVVGRGHMSYPANTLMQFVALVWIRVTRVTWSDHALVDELTARVENSTTYGWLYAKLYGVKRAVSDKLRAEWFAESLILPPETQALVDRLIAAFGSNLDSLINEMVQALHEHRDYGVKPAFFCNGLFHEPEQAWLITDLDAAREPQMDPLGFNKDLFAWIYLVDRGEITSLHATLAETHLPDGTSRLNRVGVDVPAHLAWIMDRAGTMSVDQYGILDVRHVFASAGKDLEFGLVRLAHVLNLVDLTVPIKVVRQMPPLPMGPSLGGSPLGALLDPTIVLPRLKELLHKQSALTAAFAQELEEAERQTLRRNMRRHDCVGHVRELPPGRKASPEAIERARKEGIALEPNETWVKKHQRGSGNPIIGPHRVIPR